MNEKRITEQTGDNQEKLHLFREALLIHSASVGDQVCHGATELKRLSRRPSLPFYSVAPWLCGPLSLVMAKMTIKAVPFSRPGIRFFAYFAAFSFSATGRYRQYFP